MEQCAVFGSQGSFNPDSLNQLPPAVEPPYGGVQRCICRQDDDDRLALFMFRPRQSMVFIWVSKAVPNGCLHTSGKSLNGLTLPFFTNLLLCSRQTGQRQREPEHGYQASRPSAECFQHAQLFCPPSRT